MHTTLKLETCPKFLFSAPYAPAWDGLKKRDALCIEHLYMMNLAICGFYRRVGCSAASTPVECGEERAAGMEAGIVKARE
eukprot:2799163-Prymnesium_polylepis.1